MLHGRAWRYIDEVARQGSIRKAARLARLDGKAAWTSQKLRDSCTAAPKPRCTSLRSRS